MDQFVDARLKMIEEQLVKRDIKDQLVLEAMRKVERHLFVDPKNIKRAYEDVPLPISCSQTISQPYMVALMTSLIKPNEEKVVLEIGTGSGYQTAILAEICKRVYTIERHTDLAEKSQELLYALGYQNIEFKIGDGTLGWPEKSPFTDMIITASAPEVPEDLIKQLEPSGNMVVPVGSTYHQNLLLVSKRGDSYISKSVCGCVFVPLIGKGGWSK